ncbi:MAG: glycosyltransferase family 4 protein [Verrucomicrobia bacterium]|nr:glycosyltransferase family 4 protein [Verrucomicrobiota bacterium]
MSKANPVRVVVDLTPLLPGGADGGVKPAIAEFLKGLLNNQQPRFSLFLITNSSTEDEALDWLRGEAETVCVDRPGAQGNLPETFFRGRRFDIFYAPFGMVRFPHSGLPTVSMVVDLLHRDYPASLSPQEIRWRERYFSQMAISADRFQVISDFTGRQLQEHYKVPRERIFRTYLPIQDRFGAGHLPESHKTSAYFFYPANFWPHKNHEVLFMAYQLYVRELGEEAWHLVLTGSDPGRQRQLRLLGETLGIADRIEFLGHIPDAELGRVFGAASALVFPSLHEGFAIPPLEAMRFGVPMIASESGSLGEVVGDAAFTVDPRKPLLLAEAMRRLTRSPELRQALRERGKRRLAEFSFSTELSRLANAFVDLVNGIDRYTVSQRIGHRFELWRARRLNAGSALAKRAYSFIRDRV